MGLDILIVIIIALYVISGYQQGFVYKLVCFLASILSGIALWFLSKPVAQAIELYPKEHITLENDIAMLFGYDILNQIFVFIALFLIVQVLFMFLKPIAKLFQKIPIVSFINRILGMVFGFAQALLILIAITILLSLPLVKDGEQLIEQSSLKYIKPVTTMIFDEINQYIIDDTLDGLGL